MKKFNNFYMQLISKENFDKNLPSQEEKEKDSKDRNRCFGKDIKFINNSQPNANFLHPNVNMAKNNLKNKHQNNEKFTFPIPETSIAYQITSKEPQVLVERKSLEDSDSLSQIFPEKFSTVNPHSQELREYKEYKELALANDSKKKLVQEINENSMVKMGSYYIKKRQSQGKDEGINYNNISVGRINSFVGSNHNSSTNLNNSITESSILSLSRRNLSLITMDKWDYDVKDNPQYVADYVREIFLDLKENEYINSARHGYLSNLQEDINDKMRAVLIDWLTEVHQKFKLNPETLYLTVNLIDRYLSVKKVERNRLQLVGVGAMLIASKYEEIYAPEVRDFVYITDKSYSKEEILKMEYLILTGLNFETLHVSPYTYLRRYHFITGDSMKSFYLAQYILEFSLLEYKMLLYSSSIKSSACLMTSRKLLKLEPSWPTNLVKSSGYTCSDLKPVVKDIVKILEIIPRITLRACINKFSLPKFLEVAKINMFN